MDLYPQLRQLREEQTVAVLVLDGSEDTVRGRIIALDPDWVVLHRIDDAIRFDGHVAVPVAYVEGARRSETADAVLGVLRGDGLSPPVEGPDGSTLLDRFAETDELLAVHDERPDVFWVGVLRRPLLPSREVPAPRILDRIMADGAPGPSEPLPIDAIRQIMWGSRYLEAVAMMAAGFDSTARLAPYVEARTGGDIERLLRTSLDRGCLVHVARRVDPSGWWSGVVIGLSDTLVVLQQLDEAALALDGYAAIRLDGIHVVALDQKDVARQRVLRARGQAVLVPQPLPLDLVDLLGHLAQQRVLVAVNDEDPEVCWVGRIDGIEPGADTVLAYVTPLGRSDGEMRVPTRQITLIEWGTGYLHAVASMGALWT